MPVLADDCEFWSCVDHVKPVSDGTAGCACAGGSAEGDEKMEGCGSGSEVPEKIPAKSSQLTGFFDALSIPKTHE